jgi:hypothetical protein
MYCEHVLEREAKGQEHHAGIADSRKYAFGPLFSGFGCRESGWLAGTVVQGIYSSIILELS